MAQIPETTIAYLAGFFDGEGCIQINKITTLKQGVTPRYYLMVSANQVNPAPILLLKELFGGSIYTRNDIKSRRDLGVWRIQGKQAARFLSIVLPWLKVKRAEAEIALIFEERLLTANSKKLDDSELSIREALKMQVHNLKKVGFIWD